ncbi:TIGR03564 family F420-dependent LLM class oxidoreductase [Kribbella albertanoniae]|uniref:TIGR03564 family F420-dependent LLM class oxidoreductase n=1 Tax=Kribbella albertanoniae TaxID=1266829 RepID=A0A4R4P8U9_9ACTN|nr:TIGR03564 family F420-dependent LLM class oxidoreductase [Kribbella albertanoniae]TDC17343.1 TIGR03564 family F420-dependent LLM class oxidoreductase [Kribbella albertanoniae]
MRIGLWIDEEGLRIDQVGAAAKAAEDNGIDRIWFSQRTGWDALTLVAGAAAYTSTIGFAVGVVPVYPRHPIALAAQALSVQALTGNRLLLGVGSSHPLIIEGMHGLSMERPADYMREYVEALAGLLTGEPSDYQGRRITARGQLAIAGAEAPQVIVAALGPRMLELAGELTAGTTTSWAGPELIESYIRPTIDKAAAGRPRPEVMAAATVAVTDDPDATRSWIRARFGMAGEMPSYRAVMDRGGVAGPEDTAVLGDEATVAREIERFAAAGATEFILCPVGTPAEQERTIRFAHDYARQST